MNTKKHYVLIDCDPGGDDILALLWLLINHKYAGLPFELVGITTVGGNVKADYTYANALRMCEFVGVDVVVGKDHRQIESEDASHIHGEDGIGGLSAMLPAPVMPSQAYDSVEMIINAIDAYGSDLIVLSTGPMTNLALAEQQSPGILSKAKKIIAMGGSTIHGNVTPVAEFNISYDAQSAYTVFNSAENIVLAPLDLTTSAVFKMEDMKRCFGQITHSTKQEFMLKLTEFMIGTNMKFRETGYEEGFYVHDAHVIGLLLYPHLYDGSFQWVDVETQGKYTTGQTIIDRRNVPRVYVNSFVAERFDKNLFLEALTQDFKMFDFE